MSATHDAFGSSGSNSRSSTFSATGSAWFESVVCPNFASSLAAIPASRMTLATKFTQHACPRATNSAWIRGLPYRAFTSAWIRVTSAVSSSRRSSAALGGRDRQA